MESLFSQLVWWHWLVLGMVLLIVEIIAPASFFLWISIAAFLMSIVTMLVSGLEWPMQLVLFGIFAVVSLLAGRAFLKHRPIKTDTPQLNRRGEQYIGRILTLNEAIQNGYGSVHVDDTRWRVEGPNMPVGEKVRVVSVDGTVFRVEAAD